MSLKAAIVGSGPSGFYAAEALLKTGLWQVDMLERLPVPFGLVRSGVAPDHPKLKQPTLVYDRIASMPGFGFYGNVTCGVDVSVAELRHAYHAVILACGADSDRRLGIPNEDLPGSHAATEFVGWYNGHPDHSHHQFDLRTDEAVVVGQGNVAADVCRILLKNVDELRRTDIAAHALDVLAENTIQVVHLVGRRGPVQAKLTPDELKELGDLQDVDPLVEQGALALGASCETELADRMNRNAQRNVALFREFCSRERKGKRQLQFGFYLSPTSILGNERVEGVRFEQCQLTGNPFQQEAAGTGVLIDISCGLVLRSVGYRGSPCSGVPFDAHRGIYANQAGRVCDGAIPILGLYVTGWIKRGPSGIIGTNRADSLATVASVSADLPCIGACEKAGGLALRQHLESRGVQYVDYAGWQRIDAAERARGTTLGKPREKYTSVSEMLACARTADIPLKA